MLNTVIIGSERKADFYHHLLGTIEGFQMVGYYDTDDASNYDAQGELLHLETLTSLAQVFIFDRHINNTHSALIEHGIKRGKHLLFDGFPSFKDDVLYALERYKYETSSCIQIANVLHNKPLFRTAIPQTKQVRYIKIEKFSASPLPGQLETWFQKTVAQEIDVAMRMIGSGVRKVTTRPIFMFGDQPDLLNIHVEFDNDAICSISVGRALDSGVNTFKVYQRDKYYYIDIASGRILEYKSAENSTQLVIPGTEQNNEEQGLVALERQVMLFDPWKMELRNFKENIEKQLSPLTGIEELKLIAALTKKVSETISRRYFAV